MTVLRLVKYMIFVSSVIFSVNSNADFYIIVHADNPQKTLTKQQAINLYMGRSRSFSNGDFALVFDLPRSHPKCDTFYQLLTNLTMAQVNSYWSRLMFSGQKMPPQPLPSEDAMIEIIKRNPSAIGWVTKPPKDPLIRTLLVIKESS